MTPDQEKDLVRLVVRTHALAPFMLRDIQVEGVGSLVVRAAGGEIDVAPYLIDQDLTVTIESFGGDMVLRRDSWRTALGKFCDGYRQCDDDEEDKDAHEKWYCATLYTYDELLEYLQEDQGISRASELMAMAHQEEVGEEEPKE